MSLPTMCSITDAASRSGLAAVSYTHLTLPTKVLV